MMARRLNIRTKTRNQKTEKCSLLEMKAAQARKFFLKPESYCSVELPQYFQFGTILSAVAMILKGNSLAGMIKNKNGMIKNPRQHEGVNYSLLSNKDGKHAWRPFQLIHPVLYVSLVDHITAPGSWKCIRNRFQNFHELNNFACLSIPVQSSSKREDKAAQILQWWQGIEQRSIELALEYEYVFHADITDCYGSIYTHSIAWALHDKEVAKSRRSDKTLIGNVIDWHIQDMRHGQTNGIPQGSVLMDFIAEMVLGYADLQLNERLKMGNITEYQILRYRDDYRIFVNNPQTGEAILKALTEVLIELGLKLNTSKTTGGQCVISTSLKPDKFAWILKRQWDANLQKHLLLIYAHGCEYPNAGSLVIALTQFYRRLSRLTRVQNPSVLISIAVDIANNSPRAFPVCAAIVSSLLRFIRTDADRLHILHAVHGKLSKLPNTGLMEVWLQRIGHFYGFQTNYSEALCKIVVQKETVLWNNDWITDKELKNAITAAHIFNKTAFEAMKPVVAPSEVEIFAREKY